MNSAFALDDHGDTAALGFAALALAVICAWHWMTPETVPTLANPDASAVPRTGTVATTPPPDYHEIAAWHLFGEATEEPSTSTAAVSVPDEPADATPDELPPSTAGLQVTGIVTSSTGAGARAVIMDKAGRQSENAIGDRLPGNIELYAIERARVVIRRNGVLEEIALPQPPELMPSRPALAPASTNPLTSTP